MTPEEMGPVGLAVIGAGAIGRKHAELIAAHSACSLVGICDVDPSRSSIAGQLDVPFYEDIEELFERERPQGAVISTPNGDHASVAAACAQQSVDILIEKPIAWRQHTASANWPMTRESRSWSAFTGAIVRSLRKRAPSSRVVRSVSS